MNACAECCIQSADQQHLVHDAAFAEAHLPLADRSLRVVAPKT
jgi:hypothetical protein